MPFPWPKEEVVDNPATSHVYIGPGDIGACVSSGKVSSDRMCQLLCWQLRYVFAGDQNLASSIDMSRSLLGMLRIYGRPSLRLSRITILSACSSRYEVVIERDNEVLLEPTGSFCVELCAGSSCGKLGHKCILQCLTSSSWKTCESQVLFHLYLNLLSAPLRDSQATR